MKVLIVAKTRRGGGACVGAIAEDGRSVRLIALDAETNERAGLAYEVGEVWEVESTPQANLIPPHVENIIVRRAHCLKRTANLASVIHRHMPPAAGGTEKLFEGLVQASPSGALYIAERTGLPGRSTMFWTPDEPLQLDYEGKRIRYRFPTSDGGHTLTFVGFQEPVEIIPAGTLLRVSLAHWWRPRDKPDDELRCFVQLSGWFLESRSALFCRSRRIERPIPCEAENENQRVVRPVSAEGKMERAREVLKQTFGFTDFLPVQADVIASVLKRCDTLVVMPTGGGKSLCYQLPALLFDGLTVVVSPLIALMQDQVHQLRELAVPCAFLNSTLAHHEYVAITKRIRHGGVKILYVAPETLLRPETLLLLEQSRLSCLAVDEAHCISEWGHDFRPEYRHLREVRRRFLQAVCVALTATATVRVREDICRLLDIAPHSQFVGSFNRPNLFLSVEPRHDGLAQTLTFLEKHRGQAGIIYCGTRKQADELTAALHGSGWPALPYHAGLDDNVRRQNQERFIGDDAPLMVATVAFGMGINKSNVRFVIHAHLPKDLESYYQEIGRAGRDGLPADCLLLYSRGDARTIRHFIAEGAESERAGRSARLDALMRIAEARDCRRVPLLAYFGEALSEPCGHCDNCIQEPETGETTDVTVAAQKFLSCVKRTGEVFGPAHIIAVLRGSRSARVLARGHDQLSTYGVGTEHSTEAWRELAQRFVHLRLVDQDLQFGGLRLTSKGWDVLTEKEKVLITAERPPVAAQPARPAEHDSNLFQRLRELRRELADKASVPAYVIFSDRALMEMATLWPQDEAHFLAINGVGQVKLANYGTAFLDAIRGYCQPRGLKPKSALQTTFISRPETKRRFHEIGQRFATGESIDDIAGHYAVQRGTVIQHLQHYHASGAALDPQRVLAGSSLSEADRARVMGVFEHLGLERLAPVHEALAGSIDYDELHLLRLYLLCKVSGSNVARDENG
jgi:ATP-dependent DNA helicase RecQ